MAKGPKGFSDSEKDELRNKLCQECEHSWALHGYKKTSVGDLTSKIGISTGAFYLLYSSKEELFCSTLERVQNRLAEGLSDLLTSNRGKAGFIEAVKWHFREYEKSPFLYDTSNPDFLAFLNKLPNEWVEKLKFDGVASFYEMIALAGLTPKVSKEKAYSVVNTLLFTVTLKNRLTCDQFEVFEFLLNSVIDDLFD